MKPLSINQSGNQSGAALFIILIAVALFAALGYAISQSSRGSGSIDKEKLTLEAASIIQYAAQLEQATLRLRLVNRCSEAQLNLGNSVVSGYDNPSAPTDKTCNLFSPEGGNLVWKNPTTTQLDTSNAGRPGYGVMFFSSQTGLVNVGISDGSINSVDLTMLIPYISTPLCEEINLRLRGVRSIPAGGMAYDDGSHGFCKMVSLGVSWCGGVYSGTGSGTISGAMTGCVSTTLPAPTHNYFFHALLAR